MSKKPQSNKTSRKNVKMRITLPVKVFILAMIFVLISVGIATTFSVIAYRNSAIRFFGDMAGSVAVSVASTIDPEQFSEYIQGEEDYFWYRTQETLDNISQSKGDLAFLYIMIPYDDERFFYFSSAGWPERRYFVESPEITGPEPWQAMQEGRVILTGVEDAGEWGILISAFAPIFDVTGRAVAVVGADVDIERIDANVMQFIQNAVLAGLATAIIVGFLTQLFIRRTLTRSLKRIIDVDIYSDEDVSNFRIRERNMDTGGDAIGTLYKHFDGMLSAISDLQTDLFTMSTWHMAGNYEYRIDVSRYKGYHQKVVKNINNFTESYVKSFTELLEVVGKYGDGDFTANVSTYPENWRWANDKVNDLRNNFIQVTSEIDALVESAAKGDLNIRIDHSKFGGSWAAVTSKLNNLLDAVAEPLDDIARNVTIMSQGDFSHLEGTYPGVFGILQDACNKVNDTTSALIEEISQVLKSVSEGDLTVGLEQDYVGSYAPIEAALTTILQSLNNTMNDVGRVADDVSESSAYLSKNAETLSSGASTQLISMQTLSVGIGDVDVQSRSNSSNAKKAAEIVLASRDRAEKSNLVMNMLLESMDEIEKSSKKISEITKVIENIAFQISLLSLNASIEASRAGEHGRGFSVVADEVRSLAAKSNEAAKKTADIIKESITSVEKGTQHVNNMADSLKKIIEDVMGISGIVDNIQESSSQQSEAISDINSSMVNINSTTQQATDASLDTAAAATKLDGQIDFLRQKLSFFKTKLQTVPSTKEIFRSNMISQPANIQRLISVGHSQLSFTEGEIIIREGDDTALSMFIVLEGQVDVFKSYGKSNAIYLATLEPGSIVGEMALFLNEPRTATIVAKSNVKMLEVKHDNMYKFIDDNPDIAYALVETLCIRLNNLLKSLSVE